VSAFYELEGKVETLRLYGLLPSSVYNTVILIFPS
jgi:hypothetical protein